MDLKKLFEEIKRTPVFIKRHQNYVAAVQANRDLLEKHDSYLSWTQKEFNRVFTDRESFTCYLNWQRFDDTEIDRIKGRWEHFRKLFMDCFIASNHITGSNYQKINDFFKIKIGTGGKSACINRLILNFALFDMVSICSNAHMAMLDGFMRTNFSDYYYASHGKWLEQSTVFIRYCRDNLKGTDPSEFPVFGWCLLENQKLV